MYVTIHRRKCHEKLIQYIMMPAQNDLENYVRIMNDLSINSKIGV